MVVIPTGLPRGGCLFLLHLVVPGRASSREPGIQALAMVLDSGSAPRGASRNDVAEWGRYMDDDLRDRLAIRDLIENWVVWRDAGDWQRFRLVWFDDGRMMATWTQGTADEFIEMSKQGWAKGVSILHFLG